MTQALLNPRGPYHHEENPIAPRLADLNQKVLGLIDNGKDNADIFLDYVQALIGQKYGISNIHRIIKLDGSAPAPLTEEFFDTCDFVINAFGD